MPFLRYLRQPQLRSGRLASVPKFQGCNVTVALLHPLRVPPLRKADAWVAPGALKTAEPLQPRCR